MNTFMFLYERVVFLLPTRYCAYSVYALTRCAYAMTFRLDWRPVRVGVYLTVTRSYRLNCGDVLSGLW